jgi:uncharacterized protein (TIGR02118 family)
MIKLVYIVRRRPYIPPQEFRKYWGEKHGPLVRSVAKDLRARRYVQSHTVEPEVNAQLAQTRGMGEAYDGITELWWDSLETFISALTSPAGQAAGQTLAEDEARFIDLAGSFMFMTEEHTIFDY